MKFGRIETEKHYEISGQPLHTLQIETLQGQPHQPDKPCQPEIQTIGLSVCKLFILNHVTMVILNYKPRPIHNK